MPEEEAPKVVKQESRRKGAILLPPADIRAVAPLFILGGLAFGVAGWTDVGLLWIPARLGNPDWEIGTIGRTVDALALGTLSLLLLVTGVRATGGRRLWPRLLAAACLLLGLWLAACLVIFLLNLPSVLAVAATSDGAGLKRGAAKVLLLNVAYMLMYFGLGYSMWRSTSRRIAAGVAASPPAKAA